MKQLQRMFTWLIAGGFALAIVSDLTAQTANERSGQVVRLKGHARYASGAKSGQAIKVGSVIRSGDLIQTAADSYVDIVLGDVARGAARTVVSDSVSYQAKAEQDVIRVYEDSVLGFDKLTTMKTGADDVTETQLDLRAGKILGSVKKMSAASRYEIKLPNGVAGIRGTVYTITAAGVVEVYSGSVVISWTGADGKPMTQVVNAGYQFDLRTLKLTAITTKPPPFPSPTPTTTVREVPIDQTTYYVSPKVP